MLEFRVLGPLEVADHGRPAPLGSGRQVRLLSCLLLHPNEVVPRDLLIDALWGERAPKTADTALRVQVHTLRKLLGQERIDTDGPGYRLHVGPGELDLERFEELFARGRNELVSGAADAAPPPYPTSHARGRRTARTGGSYQNNNTNNSPRSKSGSRPTLRSAATASSSPSSRRSCQSIPCASACTAS